MADLTTRRAQEKIAEMFRETEAVFKNMLETPKGRRDGIGAASSRISAA